MLLATVNEQTMVPFVSQQLNNLDLALALAKRGNLPGAESLVGQNFERLFANGQFKEAAEAAAESPKANPYSPSATSPPHLYPHRVGQASHPCIAPRRLRRCTCYSKSMHSLPPIID